jgi:hypothetical protein
MLSLLWKVIKERICNKRKILRNSVNMNIIFEYLRFIVYLSIDISLQFIE